MFEGYSTEGVRKVDASSAAFAFRDDNILCSPLVSFGHPDDPTLISKAKNLGQELRHILLKGTGSTELHAYVNYAYGNETPRELYGSEDWRQSKLQELKNQYDPRGEFSFFCPIPNDPSDVCSA